ncbi:MAG TPA: formylglycine-generating enzyme family protein [Chiayiivirga sp.]|nr:formylglycine-generating enzyme family protein [Chiayiivirga sp.]
MFRHALMALLILAADPVSAAGNSDWAEVPAGRVVSVLSLGEAGVESTVGRFELMRRPVTNAQFLAFVQAHPEWQREAVAPIFADSQYLSHWQSHLTVGDGAGDNAPVTRVSWFAATAYCEAQGGRLPTWLEWEYVAAADEARTDARSDPAWRERILGWYSKTGGDRIADVGQTPLNVYGVQDVHGLVWEWVDDFNALMMSADSREQGDPDVLKFCGAGALSMSDRDNYAILMRTAMLSALNAEATTRNMGFRCARPLGAKP